MTFSGEKKPQLESPDLKGDHVVMPPPFMEAKYSRGHWLVIEEGTDIYLPK